MASTKVTVIIVSALLSVFLVTALIVGIVFAAKGTDTVSVNTANIGTVKGTTVTLPNDNKVHEFYNIPYAHPPIGTLRFQQAVACNGTACWNGDLDARNDSIVKCIQANSEVTFDGSDNTMGQSEDCLKLTVRTKDIAGAKPVIVWIHGGGLMDGYNEQIGYSFDAESTDALDAVTVNINYRLGLLGFSALEETRNASLGLYANNGIRDQVVALEWIRDNIASFGGDPNRVTIIGESGGGTAVLCLVSSPLANNLFHNAWSMSPGPEIRFDYKKAQEESPYLQKGVLSDLGCTQSTLAERRECLMGLDPLNFSSRNVTDYSVWEQGYFDFPKRYDSELTEYLSQVYTDPTVITQSFRNLKDATYTPKAKVKVIISNMADEAAIMSQLVGQDSNIFPNMTDLKTTLTALYKNITNDANIVDTTVNTIYANTDSQSLWDRLVTDLRQTCPNNDVAEAMSKSPNHDVYRLYLSNSMELLPAMSAWHIWDTWALFDFQLSEDYAPGARDTAFRDKLRSILRNLANGTAELEAGWDTYPSETMEIGNSDPIAVVSSAKPQQTACAAFTALDIAKYGAQN